MDKAERLFEKLSANAYVEGAKVVAGMAAEGAKVLAVKAAKGAIKHKKVIGAGAAGLAVGRMSKKGSFGTGMQRPKGTLGITKNPLKIKAGDKPLAAVVNALTKRATTELAGKTAGLTIEKLAISEQLILRSARYAFEAKKFDQQARFMKAYKFRKKNLGGMFRLPPSKLKQKAATNRKIRNEVTRARNKSRHSLSKDLKGVYNI
ncbi:hypothetical protein KAR91_67915 [Candidatus Pacearchaeota archaeon]|nr:hypothetical protein [Candidatus Pacearchaeota archaeon]